jgi:XTP/dITP diphosphohydrolase
MMKKIVLATQNPGKIKEFNALLAPLNITVIPQSELNIPEIEETGLTFIENALIKARHAAALSGLPALADDSGFSCQCLRRCSRYLFGALCRKNGRHAREYSKIIRSHEKYS